MVSLAKFTFTVCWTDEKGRVHMQDYPTEAIARHIQAMLTLQGISNTSILFRVGGRTISKLKERRENMDLLNTAKRKQYKLVKDLPTFKAGQLAYISKTGNLIAGTPENQKTTETGSIIMIYHETTLKKFPKILTEWFEEIKEPTDSIHWKPELGDEYWTINSYGLVVKRIWFDNNEDFCMYRLGLVYSTGKECEKARNRKLSKARLRRTSTFKPDFENGKGGWVVNYGYLLNRLECVEFRWSDHGEPVRYETKAEAEKSIKENKKDWLIYFGVEEKK